MPSWNLLSWNVNGIRAVAKNGFMDWVHTGAPNILCVQETKAQEAQLDANITEVAGYESFWSDAEKKDTAGWLYTLVTSH